MSGPCGGGSGVYFGTLRFLAPVSGLYDVSGRFLGLNSNGTTVDFYVLQVGNSGSSVTTSLFYGYVDGFYGGDADELSGPSPIVPFSLPGLRLSAGDSLFFAMGDGGNGNYFDTTGLEVSVSVSAFGSIGPSGLADDPFGSLGGLGYWQDHCLEGSGLSYVRQRWLDTGSGSWLSVDPVASEPRYGYAHNSPSIGVDPGGTQQLGGLGGLPSADDGTRYLYGYLDGVFRSVFNKVTDPATYTGPFENYKANKQAYLMSAEHSLRSWVESQPPGRAAAFSSAFAYITGSVPFVPHIPKTVLSGMDRWFGGPASQAHRQNNVLLPASIAALLPPPPGTAEDFQYKVGFLWGVLETLVGQVDIIEFVGDILNFAVQLFQLDLSNFWPMVCEAAHELIKPILDAGHAQGKAPYDRGKIAGILLTSLILLVILIINLVDGAGEILGVGKISTKLARLLRSKGVNAKNAVVAALEMQKRFSAKGITADSTFTKLKIDATEALNTARPGLSDLPPLTRDYTAIFFEMERAASLADLKLEGVEVNLVRRSHLPQELSNKAFKQDDFPPPAAAFDVGPQSYKAYVALDESFFTQSRLRQRAILAHELAHLEQWREEVRVNGYNLHAAYAFRMRLSRNASFKLVAEAYAQRAALRTLLAAGDITPAMVANAGAQSLHGELQGILNNLTNTVLGTPGITPGIPVPSEAKSLPFVQAEANKASYSLF